MTAAEAQAVSEQVVNAAVQSLSSAQLPSPASAEQFRGQLAASLAELHPQQSSSCTPTANGESCDFPLSRSEACSGGGSISVTGDVQGTVDRSLAGSLAVQLTVTPNNCALPSVTFNGNPDIKIAGNINLTGAEPAFPVSLTEAGGISFGPNPSGRCSLNATFTINSLSSCTVSGTICGQPVNGSC